MTNVVVFNQPDPRRHAQDVKRRLWNPTGGRESSELDVISETEKRRRLKEQAGAMLEALRAQRDFERAKAAGDLLLKALDERAKVLGIARKLAEEEATPKMPITRILKAVASYYNTTVAEIISSRRQAPIVRPRQVAMYLCRELTPRSFPEIGRRIGGRDHTTALHGWRKIKWMIEDGDTELADQITRIKWGLGIR